MLGREKMNGSEMRALWGSRIVIWITIILVLFPVVWIVMSSFSAGDSVVIVTTQKKVKDITDILAEQ